MIKFIGPREIIDYLDRKDVILVDLRDKEDYDEEHIKNAINIPFEMMMNEKYNKKNNKKILLYCDRGNVSLKVALKMDKLGYDVITLTGGILGIKTFYDN